MLKAFLIFLITLAAYPAESSFNGVQNEKFSSVSAGIADTSVIYDEDIGDLDPDFVFILPKLSSSKAFNVQITSENTIHTSANNSFASIRAPPSYS